MTSVSGDDEPVEPVESVEPNEPNEPAEPNEPVDRARAGDPDAIESLLRRHLPGLHAYVRLRAGRKLKDREAVSDLVQSACREVIGDLDRFDGGETVFKEWLYRAAFTKIIDRHRYFSAGKRKGVEAPLQEDLFQSLLTPSRIAVRREEFERMEAAFEGLPADYREVILAARILGLPFAEIARRMGRSENAVKIVLSRALARLSLLMDRG